VHILVKCRAFHSSNFYALFINPKSIRALSCHVQYSIELVPNQDQKKSERHAKTQVERLVAWHATRSYTRLRAVRIIISSGLFSCTNHARLQSEQCSMPNHPTNQKTYQPPAWPERPIALRHLTPSSSTHVYRHGDPLLLPKENAIRECKKCRCPNGLAMLWHQA
jgi:hypothetical protein